MPKIFRIVPSLHTVNLLTDEKSTKDLFSSLLDSTEGYSRALGTCQTLHFPSRKPQTHSLQGRANT